MIGGVENKLRELEERKKAIIASVEENEKKISEKSAEEKALRAQKGKKTKLVIGVCAALFVLGCVMLAFVFAVGLILAIAAVAGAIIYKVISDKQWGIEITDMRRKTEDIKKALNKLSAEMFTLNAEEKTLIREKERLTQEEERKRRQEEEEKHRQEEEERRRQEEEEKRRKEEEERRRQEEEEKRRKEEEERRRQEEEAKLRQKEEQERAIREKLYQDLLACEQTLLVKELENEKDIKLPIQYLYKLKMLSKVLKDRNLEPMTKEDIYQCKLDWDKAKSGYDSNSVKNDEYIKW